MTPMFIDKECPRCNGEGKVWHSRYGGNDPDVWPKTCPECDGTGIVQCDLNDEIDDDED